MNKDKIIKDLKKRNAKLKNQNELKDIRCCHLEQENQELKNNKIKNDKLINSLNDFNYKLKQQYELLELNYLRQKKEKQELKEKNEKEFADFIKLKKEQYDEYLEKANKLIKENQKLKKQLGDRTKYIFVTECSAEQNSYFMPLAEYLDMKELPEDYEDIEYVELTDEELDYLEDCGRDVELTDFLKIEKYNKIRDMFESGSVDLEELKNIVLGDELNERK